MRAESIRRARQNANNSFKCPGEGFYADPVDCRVFHRCLSTGPAIKFECAPGTVFDPEINNCNYAYATSRPECGGNQISGSNNQNANYQDDNQGFNNQGGQNQGGINGGNVNPDSNNQSASQGTTPPPPSSGIGNKCTQEGFLADPQECKKFYRCASNGQGGFLQYEFTCGPGTVWDPDIAACNHAWDVKRENCRMELPSQSK